MKFYSFTDPYGNPVLINLEKVTHVGPYVNRTRTGNGPTLSTIEGTYIAIGPGDDDYVRVKEPYETVVNAILVEQNDGVYVRVDAVNVLPVRKVDH